MAEISSVIRGPALVGIVGPIVWLLLITVNAAILLAPVGPHVAEEV